MLSCEQQVKFGAW